MKSFQQIQTQFLSPKQLRKLEFLENIYNKTNDITKWYLVVCNENINNNFRRIITCSKFNKESIEFRLVMLNKKIRENKLLMDISFQKGGINFPLWTYFDENIDNEIRKYFSTSDWVKLLTQIDNIYLTRDEFIKKVKHINSNYGIKGTNLKYSLWKFISPKLKLLREEKQLRTKSMNSSIHEEIKWWKEICKNYIK